MMRLIVPIIFIAASIGVFVAYTDPKYKEVKQLRKEVASYDGALTNARRLEEVKQEILKTYNDIPEENIEKLEHLLPDNVDNIRLVLEIESIAAKYSMTLKNVKFDVENSKTVQAGERAITSTSKESELSNKEYGIFDFSFSTQGSYENFVKFSQEIERSLRIVDIKKVTFTSPDASPVQGFGQPKNAYQYDIDMRTYWLKN